MAIVPKKGKATEGRAGEAGEAGGTGGSNVRSIRSAGHAGGRRTSQGYDPATGEVYGGGAGVGAGSGAEYDVFALVENGYRSERFYCKTTDRHHHGVKIQVRVPEGLDSQMHAAVAEVAEYKTIHDLVRDAVVHRLEFLQKHYNLGEGARRTLELERMMADGERRAQEAEVMRDAVAQLDARLQALWEQEDWSLMKEELEKGGEMTDWLRDPYKTKGEQVVGRWKAKAKVEIARIRERE